MEEEEDVYKENEEALHGRTASTALLCQALDTLDLVNMYIASTHDQVCTCISSVDDELRGLKGPGLAQALPAHTHAAGVADLRLADHHSDGAAGNMATILLDVHKVLPNLFRHKGDACTETRTGGGGALQQRRRFPCVHARVGCRLTDVSISQHL